MVLLQLSASLQASQCFRLGGMDGARESEMLAQRPAAIILPEQASPDQDRNDLVDELLERSI
ncbi:hypothetical protein CYD53_11717 [Bosea psychrotolerans]|uniref:Uncharacterized protein n=1 Tax=Bosea psychrotolerans TaxID=1871628 RepID=A0A2S4LZ70_9HYPH|nr:hypothetical protein [Bosea psychrotolerans]POR47753.1 hypothetical protein CYD53_11717 [Bosea psychrotolerans]